MNPITDNIRYTTTPATTRRNVAVLGNNLWQYAKGIGKHTALNHGSFKRNALIFSVFGLCSARIFLSFQSALKAKGTEDEAFRMSEAIGTGIREYGGFALSFVTFSMFVGLTQKLLKKHLIKNVDKLNPKNNAIKRFANYVGKEVKSFFGNKPQQKIANVEFAFKQGEVSDFATEAPKNKFVKGITNLFSGKTAQEKAKTTYDWLPIIVGSIPSLILSGFALENFNLKHSKALFSKIEKAMGKNISESTETEALTTEHNLYQPPHLQNFQAGNFNQFLGHIYTKRLNQFSDYNSHNPFVTL